MFEFLILLTVILIAIGQLLPEDEKRQTSDQLTEDRSQQYCCRRKIIQPCRKGSDRAEKHPVVGQINFQF